MLSTYALFYIIVSSFVMKPHGKTTPEYMWKTSKDQNPFGVFYMGISPELVSKISEKIMPEVIAWQNRPLDAVYPFVFLDAIHYKVKENHQYVTKAAYVVLGINTDGRKDILGIWIGQHESAKFWAGCSMT